ncbi:MAM and LDL-receptor class A domain-containing protein 1-like [Anneissia japonica]|uniref:MAM and LDL-receptor class A domain-containing protein 1-like n=1 Tax=Anneissia japonica TaxID=1529436 RepID=UPI001425B9FE|nr:MAM and LDL-receptor class A domain-containing protein 1-like [Anneissia japonica]
MCWYIVVLLVLPVSILHLVVAIPELECSFEEDFCGFSQREEEYGWIRRNTSVAKQPTVDHTLGTKSGNVMALSSIGSEETKQQRRIQSPLLQRTGSSYCLEFYFYLTEESNDIEVIIKQSAGELSVWNRTEAALFKWSRALLDINSIISDFAIIFEGTFQSPVESVMAIDDVMLQSGICNQEFVCNFEDSFCLEQVVGFDHFNWKLGSGETSSVVTGPPADHTLGDASGHYAYIEASAPRKANDTAVVRTPIIAPSSDTGPQCLLFWYHMYGQHIETLNVYTVNNSGPGVLVWTKSGNRGNVWRPAEIELRESMNFRVVFQAVRGNGVRGDISIDDISVELRSCYLHDLSSVPSISCSFEEVELCGYVQDKDDELDWGWKNEATSTLGTGPSTDHTSMDGLGFYLYVTMTNQQAPGNTARLISPKRSTGRPIPKKPQCLEFWYHMYGDRVQQTLSVYLQDESSETRLLSIDGNHGDFWHRATLKITKETEYRVVFEGTLGFSRFGDIAIDDVTLTDGDCEIVVTTPLPSPDSVMDIDCVFERRDFCNYTQDIYDDFDWTPARANTLIFGPEYDHTLKTSLGHFMYVDPFFRRFDQKARLYSPLVKETTQPSCVKFWVYMNGEDADFFNVYAKQYSEPLPNDPSLAVYGDHGKKWIYEQVEIAPSQEPFNVVFEGVRGTGVVSVIAIDDIEFSRMPCESYFSCDFESGIDVCGFVQDKDGIEDDFDWYLQQGTKAPETGPTTDHTIGEQTEHYALMEASQPQRPGYKAVLRTPLLKGVLLPTCLKFFYFSYGEQVSSLTVYKSNQGYNLEELWKSSGISVSNWKSITIQLPMSSSSYQVYFEGQIGKHFQGDIAIDDVIIFQGYCVDITATTSENESTKNPLSTNRRTNQHYQTSAFACDFQVDITACDLRQSTRDNFDWVYYDLHEFQGMPGLEGKESYIYIRAKDRQVGQKARLQTPEIVAGSSQCLQINYIIQQTPQVLNTYIIEDNMWTQIWGTSDITGDWTVQYVDFSSTSTMFYIVIEAVIGNSGSGVIALSCINVNPGNCPTVGN